MTTSQARFDALERERISLSDDLKARERDVGALVEQKRSLEQELSRAQRALSRGAVESASIAQGELLLQVHSALCFASLCTLFNTFTRELARTLEHDTRIVFCQSGVWITLQTSDLEKVMVNDACCTLQRVSILDT